MLSSLHSHEAALSQAALSHPTHSGHDGHDGRDDAPSNAESMAAPSALPSAWSPLRVPLYRALWIASLGSNVGALMHETGATWLMTRLSPSPFVVAAMTAAFSLPLLFLSLPGGAMADVFNRRTLLLWTQGWMLVVSALLAVLSYGGALAPATLLVLTFCLGIGAALSTPAMRGSLGEWVPKPQIPLAITLNSVSQNLARMAGPLLGGVLIASAGPWAAFAVNALSFTGTFFVLWNWKRETKSSSHLPAERIMGAIRAGVHYTWNWPPLRAVLVRALAFILPASALQALLPTLARRELGLDSIGYGILLGSVGVGAVAGATALPQLRRALGLDWLLLTATGLLAGVAVMMSQSRSFLPLCAALAVGGAAWIAVVPTLASSAGATGAPWVKSRVLATYAWVFGGALALGSLLWGALAERVGVTAALGAAALALLAGTLVTPFFRLSAGEGLDVSPSGTRAEPQIAPDLKASLQNEPERGPVMVTVEYHIEPERATEFEKAMRDVRLERLRDGAFFWGGFVDAAQPERYVEFFAVESWLEHLRSHERVSKADRDLEARAAAFHVGPQPPLVSHFVSEHRHRPAAQEDA